MAIIPHKPITFTVAGTNISADVTAFTAPEITREPVDAHGLSSTFHTTRPSRLIDASDLTFDLNYDPAIHSIITALPTSGANSGFSIVFGSPAQATCIVSGYCVSFAPGEVNNNDDSNLSASLTIRPTMMPLWSVS